MDAVTDPSWPLHLQEPSHAGYARAREEALRSRPLLELKVDHIVIYISCPALFFRSIL